MAPRNLRLLAGRSIPCCAERVLGSIETEVCPRGYSLPRTARASQHRKCGMPWEVSLTAHSACIAASGLRYAPEGIPYRAQCSIETEVCPGRYSLPRGALELWCTRSFFFHSMAILSVFSFRTAISSHPGDVMGKAKRFIPWVSVSCPALSPSSSLNFRCRGR